MHMITYYILRGLLSLAFVVIIVFSGRELYRIWFAERIVLAPFAFQKNGVDDAAQGKAFTAMVYHELRSLRELLANHDSTEKSSEKKEPQKDKDPTMPYIQPITLLGPGIGAATHLPDLPKDLLNGI